MNDETESRPDGEPPSDRTLRFRAVLDRQFAVVVLVLLALVAVGGWATHGTYVDPGTHTESRAGTEWSVGAALEHNATIVEENPVFPVGTRLTNRSVYYTSVAPVLDGTHTVGYEANDGGSVTARTDLDLVYRSVDRQSGGVYWAVRTNLTERTVSDLPPGTSTSVAFSVNVTRIGNRTDQVLGQLGGGPGDVESVLVARTGLSGTVNGRDVDVTLRTELPVRPGESTYRIANPGSWTASYEDSTTETVTVENTYGPLRRLGAPVLSVTALASLVALLIGRRRGALSLTETERQWLEYRDDRTEFEEWIHAVSLPREVFERPRAEADSLADLVDVAIDTDAPVVESSADGTYHVVHGEYLYTYEAPPAPGVENGVDSVEGDGSVDDEVDVTESTEDSDGTTDNTDGQGLVTDDVETFATLDPDDPPRPTEGDPLEWDRTDGDGDGDGDSEGKGEGEDDSSG